MKTAVQVWDSADVNAAADAVALLREGGTVALPTETVYGLAANALDPEAVVKIFEVKQRPRFDPLIVHLPDRTWLERVAEIPPEDRSLVECLIEKFWPGPLTIVLLRRAIVPDIVTAGLDTVAVRMSSHPAFGTVIREFGSPVAAPSANSFGRISPTTARHVVEEFDGRIPLIIDAGPTTHGLESTIVKVSQGVIGLLRQGPITTEQLSEISNCQVVTTNAISAPGQLPSHYSPRTPLRVVDAAIEIQAEAQRVGFLAWSAIADQGRFAAVRQLSVRKDLKEAAANLFGLLRELDALELDLIVAERIPEQGLGAAIMDRLRRAAGG